MGRDGTNTRKKILNESQMLILDYGYAGTSIDMILEKTGITKGAFFYHFKTKAHLAITLINEYASQDKNELEEALGKTESFKEDPLHRLLQFIQYFIDLMSSLKEPHNGCLYASYNYEMNNFSPEVKTIIANSILLWRKKMRELLGDVLVKYKPSTNVDFDALSDQFVVIFEGSFVVSKALDQADLIANQLILYKSQMKLLFVPNITHS